ncbi:protein NDRG3 isoform X1 [Hydra vulgaris]|uniref:protein NDRG3 isoform X1 n=1 Tax=Hydra vulgaris TaxID=6087 RepID=UPI000192409F|nr:protein NDRG3 [Hydra vulgaris]
MQSMLDIIKTDRGTIHVGIECRKNTDAVLVTLHDIGQNHATAFESFFSFEPFKPVLENFTVYHLNFPGQHEKADILPEDYVYPTMDEMTDMVKEVLDSYNLQNCVCFGIGAGANVFTRLALKHPSYVECLIAINGVLSACSWLDWSYEKLSSYYLKSKGMTQFTIDYLLYHYFGGKNNDCLNSNIVATVTNQLRLFKHPRNLGLFMESYASRLPIVLHRPVIGEKPTNALKCGVLLITGKFSPAVEETVEMSSQLDPRNSTWMKIDAASSMVLEEQPIRVVNAIILFVQGYGHIARAVPPSIPPIIPSSVFQEVLAFKDTFVYDNPNIEVEETVAL